MRNNLKKVIIPILLLVFIGITARNASAQVSTSSAVTYVPLIGITSVPDPLTLPGGSGTVTFRYAVRNFLSESSLTNIQVTDDKCSPVKFVNGDDNNDSRLDSSETWRYICAAKISQTTQSIATAQGTANNMTAKHQAFATVIVDSDVTPPLVSIVNITKIPVPLPLPFSGNNITFTYKVTNPGVVPLGNVIVTDSKCSPMSGKLGDTNANNLLDTTEGWIYTCSTRLAESTLNYTTVSAFANGMKATDTTSVTVKVDTLAAESAPLFDVEINPEVKTNSNFKIIVWIVLSAVLGALVIVLLFSSKKNLSKDIEGKLSWIKSKVKNNHDETSS